MQLNVKKKNSIKDDLKVKLLSVAEDVTATDRMEYTKLSGVTRSTISQYLNGKVNDSDTALNMFLFFRKRIQDKKDILVNS